MPLLAYSKGGGRALSYSRRQSLKSCERKFQIENVIGYRPEEQNMTFAYGHFVGEAIQHYLLTRDLTQAIWQGMQAFDLDDIFAEGTAKEAKVKKDFWHAIDIVEEFEREFKRPNSLLSLEFADLEVAKFEFNGETIPAVELTFEVDCGDGFTYEGHIDAVLYNRRTDTYVILELKTTSIVNLHPAMYQNSDQALSYSVVLDKIAGDLGANSSYSVLYLCAITQRKEFQTFSFAKNVLTRANWITALQQDIQYLSFLLQWAEEHEVSFPKRGDNCFAFFRPCAYLGTCDQPAGYFEGIKAELDKWGKKSESFAQQEPAMFQFTLEEIIERQQEILEQKIDMAPVEETISSVGEVELVDL